MVPGLSNPCDSLSSIPLSGSLGTRSLELRNISHQALYHVLPTLRGYWTEGSLQRGEKGLYTPLLKHALDDEEETREFGVLTSLG